MTRAVSATEVRIHLGELLRDVAEKGDTIIVERSGKPQAVIQERSWRPGLRENRGGLLIGNWLISGETGETFLRLDLTSSSMRWREEHDEQTLEGLL
jgi:prevent-host-death family protein